MALVSAMPADALFGIPRFPGFFYSLNVCPYSKTHWRDPVNVVFYRQATDTKTFRYAATKLGWSNTSGFRPSFEGHLSCGRATWLLANISPKQTRYALTGRATGYVDPRWGITTIAVARRERRVGACLAVAHPTGYAAGRVWLRAHLSPLGFRSTYWGNNHSFKSPCDGRWSQDGWAYWFPVLK